MSLASRVIGIITSPKATYENVVAVPKPFGILLVVAILMAVGTAIPQMSESGREAIIQMQLKAMAARPNPNLDLAQAEAGLRRFAPYFVYVTVASTFIILPIITLFLSALYWALFNVVLGGTARFKQVFAVMTHAQVIAAIGVIVGLPFMINSPTMSMGGPFNLGALVPTLEAGSKLAKFLESISLFSLWSVFVNAVGMSVLYRRKITGILIVLLVVFLAFTYLGSMFRG